MIQRVLSEARIQMGDLPAVRSSLPPKPPKHHAGLGILHELAC